MENNLDIELQRYLLPQGDSELLRTKGGGLARGLNFTLAEVPTGTGGPLSPVLTTAAAAGRATAGSSVATSALGLNVLGEPQVNDSIQGTIGQSTGTVIPNYDPAVTGHTRPRRRPASPTTEPARWLPAPRCTTPESSRASPPARRSA